MAGLASAPRNGHYAIGRPPLIEEAVVYASRSSRRSARLAASALFAGFAVLTAVSACSAGQIAQTSNAVPAVPGANLTIGDPATGNTVQLLDMVVAYNGPQGYPAGGSAPLFIRVFNNGPTTVKLVKVTAGNAARTIILVGTAVATPPVAPTATSTARPSGTPSSAPSGSATPAPEATPTEANPGGEESFSIDILPSSYALLVPGQGAYLQLSGLSAALIPGQSVPLTFTFADGRSGEMAVPVGVPEKAQPRVTETVPVNQVPGGHE
jgi:copper(I)-binding protein